MLKEKIQLEKEEEKMYEEIRDSILDNFWRE